MGREKKQKKLASICSMSDKIFDSMIFLILSSKTREIIIQTNEEGNKKKKNKKEKEPSGMKLEATVGIPIPKLQYIPSLNSKAARLAIRSAFFFFFVLWDF